MKLSSFDAHDFASQIAADATVKIAAIQPQILPAAVEDEIEHVLADQFEEVLNRLEFNRDGDVHLIDEGAAVLTHPAPVTH
jgi:hypothetical protein